MDEVIMAGSGKVEYDNQSYYLYNNKFYWTMSPSSWKYSSTSNYAEMYCVWNNGRLHAVYGYWPDAGIRPVINLRSDTKFTVDGNGTQSNPYVVL